jgi:glutathione S-transferase
MRVAAVALLFITIINCSQALSTDVSNSKLSLHNAPMRFLSNKMCPYAQKAWIALEASKLPYKLEEIDLYGGKPDWLWELNSKGTVPVLVLTDGGVLPDSDIIVDWIESQESARLKRNQLCTNTQQEATKEWRRCLNTELLPIGKESVLAGRTISDKLKATLTKLDAMVVGPYLTGKEITTADCHAFPFLWRLNDKYGLDNYLKLAAWIAKCSKEEPFQITVQSSYWWWW